jgi:O-antigen ligase
VLKFHSEKKTGLAFLIEQKPEVLFILFSLITLLLPHFLSRLGFLLSGILFIVKTQYPFREVPIKREIRDFSYILFLYGFWILLSTLVHYSALGALDPFTYITVTKDTAEWGIAILKDTTLVYLLFPVFFLLVISLLRSDVRGYRMLFVLPLLIIPSLVIALYQGIIDITFLNHPYFIELNRVSGLTYDSNEFGLSLFLLLPLCIIAILVVQGYWKKLSFIVLAIFLFWGLLLNGSLTGFAGLIIFLLLLPWIVAWAARDMSRVKRSLLLLCPFILILLLGFLAFIPFKRELPLSPVLIKRLYTSYEDYRKGGIEYIAQKSGRMNLGYNAYRLSRHSPLSGWGPGGELRNLQNVRLRYRDVGYYFLMDNANNHYLQMSSELGLLGGAFNLFLHMFPLWTIFCVRKSILGPVERLTIGTVFTVVCIMMLLFIAGPHTMSVSVLWIFVVMLSYLFVTALTYGYSFRVGGIKSVGGFMAILTLIFFIGTYNNAFGREGYLSRQSADWWPNKYARNCYNDETLQEGVFRWCKKDSSLQFSIKPKSPLHETVSVNFRVYHPDVGQKPVRVSYGGKEGPVHGLLFKDNNPQTVEIPLSGDYLYEIVNPFNTNVLNRYFVLSLDVSRIWVPKDFGVSDDTRELGVGVLIPNEKKLFR